ncbi:MAG: hypothetical protein VKL60_17990 [Sphaerospermopsis sp.]|nr:hypothetical protein [Sphaerospermopsis sp.]
MQVINNNELFTQVAAEESSLTNGGGSEYTDYGKYMQPYGYAKEATSASETPATFLPLLQANGLITLAEAFDIDKKVMRWDVLKILAGLF